LFCADDGDPFAICFTRLDLSEQRCRCVSCVILKLIRVQICLRPLKETQGSQKESRNVYVMVAQVDVESGLPPAGGSVRLR
jgi:hypothetical protein